MHPVLDDALLADIIKTTLVRGGEYADVFVEERFSTMLSLEDSRIEKASTGVVKGAGVRLISEGRTAFAYSNDLSPKALIELARTLSAASSSGALAVEIDLRAIRPGASFDFKLPPDRVPVERKAALITEADRACRALSHNIRQCTAHYRDTLQRVKIANSKGALSEETRIYTLGAVHVVAEKGGLVQTGYGPVSGLAGFEIFESEPLHEAALNAAKRALALLDAPRAKGGRMPVVISSEAGGTMIHEAIGHGLESDLAGQGLSRFGGRKGQTVASGVVSVIDDPTLPGRRGSYGFDDEATPSRRNVLVENGVLRGYMYDRLSAMRDGAEPTGNGRRESYASRPIPRMSNTFIAPGTTPPDEVLRSTQSGLFVRNMGGGQVNTVTGEFVFDVQEGYMIEGGRLGSLVRGATLTGSGPEVLMSIDMVGSDLGFSIGTCGKDGQGVPVSDALPTLRVPEMVVGGEVGG